MKIWIKLGWREIKNNRRFSLFFIINLAIGLVGFIALNSFNASIHSHMDRNARAMLTADLSVRSPRLLTVQELDLIETTLHPIQQTRLIEFVSMAATEERSRLSQVIAIDSGFPIYGHIELDQRGIADAEWVQKELLDQNAVWVSSDLLTILDLKIGDTLNLGKEEFRITGSIIHDPNPYATLGVLSRIYMGISNVQKTDLLQTGSRANYRHFYQLRPDQDGLQVEQELQEALETLENSSDYLRVRTPQSARNRVGRALKHLNRYLGLVSLIALFLSGLGAAYLFRNYFRSRTQEIAILMSLGARRQNTYLLLFFQILMLGGIAAIFSVFLSLSVLPWLPEFAKDFLPSGYQQEITWSSIGIALFTGILGSLIFCLPILINIHHIQPLTLLHELTPNSVPPRNVYLRYGSYLPGILVYWGLAVWLSNWLIGSLFVGIFIAALIILSLIGWQLFNLCGRLAAGQSLVIKIALRNLNRNRFAALSCFLAIALGTLFINLVPQIQRGIQNELNRSEEINIPTFFLINIQEEQVDELTAFVQRQRYTLENVFPAIRGRLMEINGKPYEHTHTDKGNGNNPRRRRHRHSYNLSYFSDSQPTENIIEGEPIQTRYEFDSGQLAEVSVESEFVSRTGIQIGDKLTFEVMNVLIESKLTNIRKAEWRSIRPNFFFLFQPGVLDDAPKSFFASISNVKSKDRISFQTSVVDEFPNITMIDIPQILERVLEILDQISLAIKLMAYLVIIAGLVVVYSIARHEIQSHLREMNLLKVLGANFKTVRGIVLMEFGILAFSATFLGV